MRKLNLLECTTSERDNAYKHIYDSGRSASCNDSQNCGTESVSPSLQLSTLFHHDGIYAYFCLVWNIFPSFGKKLAELFCHYKDFSNFAFGNHSGFFSLTLFLATYKVTKNSAIYQIIKYLNILLFSSNSR